MKVIKDIEEMQGYSRDVRKKGLRIAFIPTMGFLHDGHIALIKRGKTLGDVVVVSIYVNPMQFGPEEDFSTYPRDLERDLHIAKTNGVDTVFCPSSDDMYPPGFQTSVDLKELSRNLCGLSRPGHFMGVATVVTKLFNIVMPHVAVFGLKDYQQFLIIRRLVKDLNMDIDIVGVATVRDRDGLALSSRNQYLNERERRSALSIPRALDEAREEFKKGERNADRIIEKVKKIIENSPLTMIEYIKVCDPETLEDIDVISTGALLALAVRIGRARLIDNCILGESPLKEG